MTEVKTGLRVRAGVNDDVDMLVTLDSRPHNPHDGYEDEKTGDWVPLHPAVYVSMGDDVQRAIGLDVQMTSADKETYDRYVEQYGTQVAKVIDAVWTQFGFVLRPGVHVAFFSYKAGCDCGCSPGFTINSGPARDAQRDFWLTIELDPQGR